MNVNTRPPFRLMGLKLPYKTRNANLQAAQDCGALWTKFGTEKVLHQISHRQSDDIFAVYYDYDSDANGDFSYFIGYQVEESSPLIAGLQELFIPQQQYIKRLAKGPMPDCVAAAWQEIWRSPLIRRYGFDFEQYGPKSSDWQNAEVEIFLSV